ncbi:serine/threonine-protein phosphatase 2A 56 kDa regulatory subunit delta isoform-like [Micropterus salmoides]|uniref:serine/threonine-protein phosphatase 2A 56 kDa regulatory subunit delta isoform-like n=1 Tax=Micropterus salmoides TaxID=27706 RepID=UPI0018ED6F07|nr:serine/threonine-protein phosphatase 2A 56 kDa regulatory subunit delta isoform-like [Micropterus salmoides]XP_045919275.1 serine/threonine-protein phosphatase 2A 56 kDa regulatory subunit delta isoform-like [Micropterus dolomieu]
MTVTNTEKYSRESNPEGMFKLMCRPIALESSKSGRSKKSGSKNGPADDQDGSNKKVPPATQLMRVKQPVSHSAVKREKRFSTSSFPLSAKRELQKLPELAGMRRSIYSIPI